MNFKDILGALEKGAAFAEELMPMIKMIPGVGNAASLVETVVKATGAVREIAQNVQERVAEGAIMASETDQGKLKEIIERLDRQNDELHEYIVNS